MDLNQLFRLKEEMLKDLLESVEGMTFKDEETKKTYTFTSMEAIMDFYNKAVIVIIGQESKKRAA